MRPVGGADLAQHRARAAHDVRDAELAADLDELAARDDDFLARARDSSASSTAAAQLFTTSEPSAPVSRRSSAVHVRIAGAALLLGEVHLEVGVAARHHAQPLQRQRRQQRAAQVRVEHHAGGIDHAREREGAGARERGHDSAARAAASGRRAAAAPPAARRCARAARASRTARSARRPCGSPRARAALQRGEHRVHRGQPAEQRLRAARAGRLTHPRQGPSPRAPSPARSPRWPRAAAPRGSRPPGSAGGGAAPPPR